VNHQTGLFYVATREECGKYFSKEEPFQEGRYWFGGHTVASENAWGALRALDPGTGQLRWEFRHVSPPMAGILSTADRLVLSGDMEGNFMAFDARGGQNLWHVQTGAAIVASPMTYSVKGKQYVTIASQSVLFVFGLSEVSSEPRRAIAGSEAVQKKYKLIQNGLAGTDRAQGGDVRNRSLG
jgi:outer membrane protein assembly factor BamB